MPWPDPSPIDLLSHSQVERLRACLLQEAFTRDQRHRHSSTPSTAALLGRVSHELSEAVASRSVTSDEELERRWDELIAAASAALRDVAFTERVPAPHEWPGYQLSRARALVALRRLIRSRQGTAQAVSESLATHDVQRSVLVEVEIVDEALRLIGRIDRVERDHGGTRIVDLKAGWTQDLTITDRQRRQLLLYAHLWHARTGEWPTTASIQLADHRSSEILVDVDEAGTVVADAIEWRRRFNERIPQGWDAAATPSEEACTFCDFKACCPSFMSEADPSWKIPGEWVRGRVATPRPHDGSVSLDPDDAAHSEHDELTVIGLPPDLELTLDERVGFAGLSRTVVPNTLRATWRSTLCRWS